MPQSWIVTVCREAAGPEAEDTVVARWLVAAETKAEAERTIRTWVRPDHICRIDPAPPGEAAPLGIDGRTQ